MSLEARLMAAVALAAVATYGHYLFGPPEAWQRHVEPALARWSGHDPIARDPAHAPVVDVTLDLASLAAETADLTQAASASTVDPVAMVALRQSHAEATERLAQLSAELDRLARDVRTGRLREAQRAHAMAQVMALRSRIGTALDVTGALLSGNPIDLPRIAIPFAPPATR